MSVDGSSGTEAVPLVPMEPFTVVSAQRVSERKLTAAPFPRATGVNATQKKTPHRRQSARRRHFRHHCHTTTATPSQPSPLPSLPPSRRPRRPLRFSFRSPPPRAVATETSADAVATAHSPPASRCRRCRCHNCHRHQGHCRRRVRCRRARQWSVGGRERACRAGAEGGGERAR